VAVAVVLHDEKVLVQTRADPGRWQGYWEFPGGGVEPGESAEAAVRRECLEEVALPVEVVEPIECRKWRDQDVAIEVEFFLCTTRDADALRPLLGQRLEWVGADELDQWQFLPANDAVIEWMIARLRAGDDERA
jgi:8-oxo-dGTP diphosphatase